MRNSMKGFRSLYSGLSCALVATPCVNLVFAFVYEHLNSSMFEVCKCLRLYRHSQAAELGHA